MQRWLFSQQRKKKKKECQAVAEMADRTAPVVKLSLTLILI